MLYSLLIQLYAATIGFAALFHPKARLWQQGRKGLFHKIKTEFTPKGRLIWFHCASLGEFEQGRPVMEAFKKKYPDFQLLITFFSPSGYENKKHYAPADYICYLPVDTKKNAEKFIDLMRPDIVVFVKYEFWFHYLQAIKAQKTPLIFISSAFRTSQFFFKSYGKWFRRQLKNVDHFFVQNENSIQLLKTIGITQASISGDTRFDRVAALAENCKPIEGIALFAENKSIMLAGSCWQTEESILEEWFHKNTNSYKLILAPHDISEVRIRQITERFSSFSCIRYSEFSPQKAVDADVLIIDSIGLLNSLYQYARYALVGGGFGSGLHNILEAATYGIPVFYGPKTEKYPEAKMLIDAGGGFEISNSESLDFLTKRMDTNQAQYQSTAKSSKTWIENGVGATEIILAYMSGVVS